MDIWKVLGTEPTVDKKAIKKAYAAKTREIHPEERPEEFQQLHEAYQAALAHADFFLRVTRGEEGIKINISPMPGSREIRTVRMSGSGNSEEEEFHRSESGGSEEETYHRSESGGPEEETYHRAEGDGSEEETYHRSESNGAEEETYYRAESNGSEEETYHRVESDGSEVGAYHRVNDDVIESGQSEAQSELVSYFENQQVRVDDFIKHWNEFTGVYRNPEAADWWKEYLASEEFQSIKEQGQVLHLLVEEIDHKFFYGLDEVKMWFWDAYAFQEGQEEAYQGDKQKLWEQLYPAYVKQQQNRKNKKHLARYEKGIRIFAVSSIVLLFLGIIILWKGLERGIENEIRFLQQYMARQYPDTTFSEPERCEEYGGSHSYAMYPAAHPDLQVNAWVKRGDEKDGEPYLVTENYNQMLLQYYAAQYGLDMEPELYDLIFYPDIEEMDAFCETVERMFREQPELERVSSVAICAKNVVFPEILLQGGVEHFPFAELQSYDLRNMDAASLADSLREAYMLYMFQYEPWNITKEQYRQWGPEYEKRSEEWVDDKGGWHEVYDPDTGELLCRLFIPTYEYIDMNHHYGTMALPTRFITVGNAYYFLQDKEADITVNEDGDGFEVRFYGYVTSFGNDAEVEFNDLRECY